MLNLFLPNKHVTSIFEITPSFLQTEKKRGIIVDLDNTLVPWNEARPTIEVKKWLHDMVDAGILVTIFSNNNEDRVATFTESLNIPFVFRAKKPLKGAFYRAQKKMQLKRDDIVVIGDQLITDILGGNRAKFYTILVMPIVESDAKVTKINRLLERKIMNHFYKKGKLIRGKK